MKGNSAKRHTMSFDEIDLRVIKFALEYFVMKSEENCLCEGCNTRVIAILDLLTKITDGKSLSEQVEDAKKAI